MNTRPDATAVLCYGDSNVHGTRPDRNGRYLANVRWTGIMQEKLGDGYYVIEEGLGGRPTDLEHTNPGKPSRNGLTYFKACLESHMPLDVIIILLGTNDLKVPYNRTAEDIAKSVKQFPEYVASYCRERDIQQPQIILVSPPYMNEKAPLFLDSMPAAGIYDKVSAQKSREFSKHFEKVASETGCVFFDAATITETGDDGCHIDEQSHQNLGQQLAEIVETLK